MPDVGRDWELTTLRKGWYSPLFVPAPCCVSPLTHWDLVKVTICAWVTYWKVSTAALWGHSKAGWHWGVKGVLNVKGRHAMAVAREVTWGQYFLYGIFRNGLPEVYRVKNVLCNVAGSNLQSFLVQMDTALFYLWKVPVMCSGLPLTSVKLCPLTRLVNLARELCQSLIRSETQSQPESWQYLCNSAWRLLSWGEPSKEEKFCVLRPKLVTFKSLTFFLEDLSINFNEAFPRLTSLKRAIKQKGESLLARHFLCSLSSVSL